MIFHSLTNGGLIDAICEKHKTNLNYDREFIAEDIRF